MKKVIGGKLYDSDKAERVLAWANHFPVDHPEHCTEILHKTKKGAFFISGQGGAASKYATRLVKGHEPGEGLEVLSRREALSWLEEHEAPAKTIMGIFPDLVEEA